MRTQRIAASTALALVAAMGGALAAPADAASAVRFSSIYFDSPGSDTGTNSSLNHEWVRVHNYSGKARALTGWTIRDTSGHVFRFPTFKLRAGSTVTVHTGRGRDTRTDLYWRSGWYVWNNDGDTATLKTKGGSRVDRCHYSGAGSSTSC